MEQQDMIELVVGVLVILWVLIMIKYAPVRRHDSRMFSVPQSVVAAGVLEALSGGQSGYRYADASIS